MGEVNSIKCVPKMYIEGKKGTWRLSWRTPKGQQWKRNNPLFLLPQTPLQKKILRKISRRKP